MLRPEVEISSSANNGFAKLTHSKSRVWAGQAALCWMTSFRSMSDTLVRDQELAHSQKGSGAVADTVFDGVAQLGEGLIETIGHK